MAAVIQRVELSLRSFYIFNASFGVRENEEHKKILYYHPEDIELNSKIKDVGLSEAIIAFSGTFSDENPCKALHTQKTTQLFYQAEPGYWLVLVINVPKEIRCKDGVEVADYRGCEVHDRIFRAILEQCYNTFRLFHGTFQMNYDQPASTMTNGAADDDAKHTHLQQCLRTFYDKHLPTLKLSACDVWDFMRSIQYLPLEKLLFLRAHNFVNTISSTYPAIREMIFLYNDQVVCSGKLNPVDLFILHEYLLTLEPIKAPPTPGDATSDDYRAGAFILPDLESASGGSYPKAYLQRDGHVEGSATSSGKLQEYDFIVYRALNATLCLFVVDHRELPSDFYTELHSYMGPQLSSIARDIDEMLSKQQQLHSKKTAATHADADGHAPKYLFVDEQSLKHLSNISRDRRWPKATTQTIPAYVMNLIADLHSERPGEDLNGKEGDSAFEEVQVKAANNFWIVKRRRNWRQYYVIIFNTGSLLDVTNEAKRIFDQELTDDVFFDK